MWPTARQSSMESNMAQEFSTRRKLRLYLILLLAFFASGCATYVTLPLRLDLCSVGTLGLVSFSSQSLGALGGAPVLSSSTPSSLHSSARR